MLSLRLYRYPTLLFALLLFTGCAAVPISPPATPSALDPHGPAAAHLAELWWVMLAAGTVIFVFVIALLVAAIRLSQRGTSDTIPDSKGGDTGRNWAIWGGIALPLVVIGILFGYSTYILAAVENPPNNPRSR